MFCRLLLFQNVVDKVPMNFCSALFLFVQTTPQMSITTMDGFQKDKSVFIMSRSSRLAGKKMHCRSSHGFGCSKEPMELYMWALVELWFWDISKNHRLRSHELCGNFYALLLFRRGAVVGDGHKIRSSAPSNLTSYTTVSFQNTKTTGVLGNDLGTVLSFSKSKRSGYSECLPRAAFLSCYDDVQLELIF